MELKLFFFVMICGVFGNLQSYHQDCGRRTIGRIVGGSKVESKDEWPWLVAFVNKVKHSFSGSGSLISEKHIVSGELKVCLLLGLLTIVA